MGFAQAAAAVILAMVVGELLKVIRRAIRGEKLNVFGLGGFVSVHAALVSSLFLAVYLETGFSILLVACGVFAGIVLRDAYGVRWEVSRHSEALNKLTKSKEYAVTGHKGMEVLTGILVGLLVTGIVYLLF